MLFYEFGGLLFCLLNLLFDYVVPSSRYRRKRRIYLLNILLDQSDQDIRLHAHMLIIFLKGCFHSRCLFQDELVEEIEPFDELGTELVLVSRVAEEFQVLILNRTDEGEALAAVESFEDDASLGFVFEF